MNIGGKLILSFVLVTLLPTILLAYLTTSLISSSNREDAQETINRNLKTAWMQYYARGYQMQYGMLQASTHSDVVKAVERRDSAFLRRQMKEWKKYRPYVDLWAVVDNNSVVIADLNTPATGQRMAFGGLVEKAVRKKSPFISSEAVPYETLRHEGLADSALVPVPTAVEAGKGVNPLKNGLMLLAVVPVASDDGRAIGAIITGDLVNNDTFVPDSLADGIPGSLVSVALGGVQISTNAAGAARQRNIGQAVPEYVVEHIKRNGSFRGEALIADGSYLTAFDPIVNSEGRIIGSLFVGVPRERFAGLEMKSIKAVTSISVVGLLIAAGAGILITYMITRPIKSLTKKAQLVSSGNLDIRPAVSKHGNDEITDLERSFDLMVRNLSMNEERISLNQLELRQQKNLIESIINSLPYCLYVLERSGAIVFWNRHTTDPCPICNCSSEDCYNLNFIAHITNIGIKRGLDDVIKSVFETGEAVQFEQKVKLKPGDRNAAIRTSVFPIFSSKGRTADYVVWMAEDITKKKEMEASVLTSEKLSAIGQLAAGIAHEVNNPLGGILNCLYNFKKKKLTEERKAEYLDFMEEGIKRVQNIVRQLLDFSQQHAPELKLTDVNVMIEGIMPLFLHTIKGKDIRLVKNLGQGLPAILVDKHQIEQILVNLILNAVQAVDGEGVIEVSTKFDDGMFCIQVSDNGCGIPPENIPKIFDPFFTTKGVGKGTGLGLSVSRGIIERHRGRIDVDSAQGRGTVFKVYLPMAPAETRDRRLTW